MIEPSRISLHIALVLGMVIMAVIDQSRSSTTLYTFEELGSTTLDADAVGEPQYQSRDSHNTRLTGRRIVEPAVTVFPKPKRAKFEPRRRQQVANVRKKGACMRCRIKKLPCSGSFPCNSCQRSQAGSRITFDRWEQCVSFSMKEANIYAMDYPCDEDTCPSFDDSIKLDVGSISSEFVLWMTDDHAQPGSTSLVGILASSTFESMISKFVDESLGKNVRQLVRLTSILYLCGSQDLYADSNSTSWRSLRSFAGNRVLQELESALANASLAAASLEKLTALFLVQFATIIAVGYSKPRNPNGDAGTPRFGPPVYQSQTSVESCASGLSAQAFAEAQKHLLCILAHHMVYIAERINLLEPKVCRKRIIEGSACRWNRTATFRCEEMPTLKDAEAHGRLLSSINAQENSRRLDGALLKEYPAHCYHISRSHTPKSNCRLAGGFGTCVHEQSLNIEPSPMDQLLARFQQMNLTPLDEENCLEDTSTSQVELKSIQQAPHPTSRRSSSGSHLPSMSTRDKNYAAFECLAETDGMCAPFLCTDSEDSANETSSMNPSSALTPSPFTLQGPEQSFSATAYGPSPNIRSQESTSAYNLNLEHQVSVCRSCKFAQLPFGSLDQDDLCQFCSALPLRDGGGISAPDISTPHSASNDPSHPPFLEQAQLDWLKPELESGNLLV